MKVRFGALFFAAAACCGVMGFAAGKENAEMKKGIVLVAFGTSVPEARIALDHIDRRARERFKDIEIRWAYTSTFIRRKLAKEGLVYNSPLAALVKMHEEGFTHVAVQSLHIAAGAEFHELAKTVSLMRSGPDAFRSIALGKPLLVRRVDVERVVESVLGSLPELSQEDAVVLMGHGNEHGHGDMAFLATAAQFQKMHPRAFLGTVEGQPSLDDVIENCRKHLPKRAYLVPFMGVAGDHARNDLAGDEPDSWKSSIAALGIECIPVLKGMGEIDGVVDVWLDHLSEALKIAEKE